MAEAATENDNQQENVSRETEEQGEGLLLDSVKLDDQDQTAEPEPMSHREEDDIDPENVEFERPEYFPEKFWDEEEGPQIEKLVKSYGEMSKQFSMGEHKAPKDGNYQLENIIEGKVEKDDPVLGTLLDVAKQYNAPQAMVKDLVSKVLSTTDVELDRIESNNQEQMEISIKYSKLENIKASPTLFFEFHGSEESNKESIKIVEELSKNNGGSDFKWADSIEERNKLWKARHDVYYSVKSLGKNMKVYSTDICVPISKLVECISWAENEVKKHGLIAPMVGHVGDGNFHSIILYDPNDKEKQKLIKEYSDNLIEKALELDGTITGEHGIGLQKKSYLLKEHPDNLPVMKSIKRSLDANNIMNPGKVFDLN